MKYIRRDQKSWWRIIWGSSAFTLFLLVILVLSLVKMTREIMIRREINQEIKTLENQLTKLEGQKAEVEKLISYLQSDQYIEKEARLKLNLLKPGEKQVNIPDITVAEAQFGDSDQRTNVNKWFDYFFK